MQAALFNAKVSTNKTPQTFPLFTDWTPRTLKLLNLTVITHMLLLVQQSGLHKFHLSRVLHTKDTTSSCNLSQSHTIQVMIHPMWHLGPEWRITEQSHTCSSNTYDINKLFLPISRNHFSKHFAQLGSKLFTFKFRRTSGQERGVLGGLWGVLCL